MLPRQASIGDSLVCWGLSCTNNALASLRVTYKCNIHSFPSKQCIQQPQKPLSLPPVSGTYLPFLNNCVSFSNLDNNQVCSFYSSAFSLYLGMNIRRANLAQTSLRCTVNKQCPLVAVLGESSLYLLMPVHNWSRIG